ncbi:MULTISPECIES: hypothetical protein [Rhodomicrobium]|uniref:hypothetical protein n=1 Tax=Rhodomicrobium TaxID=1068 RepID=UPI000B4AFCE9|nr:MULTISPECIES: hypothetical protein [Rhodomicrobium]
MGRSFDRGGQNRKERERGKRRSFRQNERDREARDAVMLAKRTAAMVAMAGNRAPRVAAAAATVSNVRDMPVHTPAAINQPAQRPGFFAAIGRLFKKSA